MNFDIMTQNLTQHFKPTSRAQKGEWDKIDLLHKDLSRNSVDLSAKCAIPAQKVREVLIRERIRFSKSLNVRWRGPFPVGCGISGSRHSQPADILSANAPDRALDWLILPAPCLHCKQTASSFCHERRF
jgi:hypothetical protein